MPVDIELRPGMRGHIIVGGHDISASTCAVNVDASGPKLPTVELTLIVSVVKANGDADVLLDEATREALVDLGWTPPAERPLATGGIIRTTGPMLVDER